MKKSLLMLLKREDELVKELRFNKESYMVRKIARQPLSVNLKKRNS